MKLNTIIKTDVMEGMKLLPDKTIDIIITSPPYNKAGLNGIKSGSPKNNWKSTIDYGGDINIDCKSEDEYQRWQIDFLNECERVLRDDGSLFYNHKNRIHKGFIVSPYEWILKSRMRVRQEITWDRGSSNNLVPCRYIPSNEIIFWLTKSKRVSFIRPVGMKNKRETWKIGFERNSKHPAPFPLEIPDTILDCIPNNNGDKIVLDPFMGSGTVAISAIKHDFHWLGFELLDEYVHMANNRIRNFYNENYSNGIDYENCFPIDIP